MFGKKFRIFTLLGFEVNIDASWLIIAVLIVWSLAVGYFPYQTPGLSRAVYWWMAVAGAVGLFASIIVHEFSHSLVARREGIPMKGITLFIFGGVAEMDAEPPTAGAEFRMAIAGPVMSVLVGILCYGVYLTGAQWSWPIAILAIFSYLAFINIVLAIFNMLPAFPLDGGRVLRGYLWNRSGNLPRSTRTVSRIGAGFGTAFMALGVLSFLLGNLIGGIWWFLIGMFLRGASQMSYRQLQIRRALEGEPVARFMRRDPVIVPSSVTLQHLVDDYVYEHYFDMFPVEKDSRLVGCITTRALKRVPREEWSRKTVGEIAEPCAESNTIPPQTDAVEALETMTRNHSSRLLVSSNGHVEGIITLKDLLGFLSLKLDLEGGGRSSKEVMEEMLHK